MGQTHSVFLHARVTKRSRYAVQYEHASMSNAVIRRDEKQNNSIQFDRQLN